MLRDRFQIGNKLALIGAILVLLFPMGSELAQAAAAEITPLTVSNAFMEVSVNKETGRFSVNTKQGSPLKAGDDNKALLFKDQLPETSFTTFRINGKDYIFGNGYGFMGSNGSFTSAPANQGLTNKSVWNIEGLDITQTLTLVDDATNPNAGNMKVTYQVKNTTNQNQNVGSRILLDTMLGPQDASPISVAGGNTYISNEKVISGQLPYYWSATDNPVNPKVMSYGFMQGWGNKAPNQMIIAHWNGISQTKWEYTVNPLLDFTNKQNAYGSADSAVALYWDPANIAPGGEAVFETYYGLGSFFTSKKEATYRLQVGAPKQLTLNEDRNGYKENEFEIRVDIDNGIDRSVNMDGVQVTLGLPDELELTSGQGITKTVDSMKVGETQSVTWRVKPKVQLAYKAAQFQVIAQAAGGEESIQASYVVLPALTGEIPSMQLLEVFPRKLYTLDEKPAITLQGAGFEILKGSSGWSFDMIRDRDGASVAIPSSDVSIQDDKQITARLNLTSDLWKQHKLEVGSYTVRLTAGSKTFEKKIEFTLDKSFKSKDYGILLVVGDNMTQKEGQTYRLLPVKSETELANYKMEVERSGGRQVSLLEIRGSIRANNGDGGKVVYEIDKGSTINSVIHHDTTDMLTAIFGEASQKMTIQKSARDSTHDHDYINLKGNGALSIPNFKFAYGPFSVELEDGKKYALEANEEEQEHKIEIKWDVLKGLSIIQRLAWFELNIKNAVIGTESVSFGGRLALDFEPGPKKDTGKEGDSSASGQSSNPPNNPPNNPPRDDSENVEGEDDGAGSVLVSVDLDEAKFGIRPYDNAFGPAGKFGFLGLRAEGEAGLPKNLVPGLDLGVDGVVRVDTFEKKYEIEANVQFKVVEVNGLLTIRLTDTNFPIVDNFRFVVGGEPGIPLIPIAPVAYITKGGGGIYNIYDTLMGNYQFLPPLKLEMIGGLSIAKVFKADDATVGLSMRGVEFSGAFEVLGIQLLEEVYGSVLLKDSFSQFGVELKAGAKINIKDILTGEVYVVFRYDPEQHGKLGPVYLAGGGNVKVKLPRGLVLAAAEGEISSEKVAGTVEFIGIPWGFEYEWGDKKPTISVGKHSILKSRSLTVGEDSSVSESTAPELPAKNFMEETYYDESGNVSGTMSFGTNMKPIASSGPRSHVQLPTRSLFRAASPNVYSIPVTTGQELALLDITYSGDPAELQVMDPAGNLYPLVSGENYDIQEVSAEESTSGEREQSVLISMKNPIPGTWRVTTDRELEWTLENVTVPPTFTSVDVQQSDAMHPRHVTVNWLGDHTTNEKVSLFLSTNNENDPGSLLVQDLDVSAGTADIVLPDTTPSGSYYVKAVMSQGETNLTSKYSSQPLNMVNPYQPASPSQVHLSSAGNGLFKLSWDEQAVDGYTVQVLDENGNAIPSLGVIELAGNVNKAAIGGTVSNEAGEKVGMLPGSTYKVSIGAYKLVGGIKVYSEPAVTDAVLLPQPQPANVQLSVLHANHEPVTNTYSQDGTTTYIMNENNMLLHMQADQAVSTDVIVNNVKQEPQSGSDWNQTISLNEGENVIQLFSTNLQGDITASSVRVVSDTTLPDLKVENARTTTDQQTVFVKGMAEPGSTVMINDEPIDVQKNGAFEKSMPMEGYLSKPVVVTAKDIAGNETVLNTEVVNSQLSSLTKVELRAKEGQLEDGVLQLEEGSGQSLELIGTDKDGNSFNIDPSGVKWSVLLGETNGNMSEQGRLDAAYEGDMVIKASYSVAGDFAFEDTIAVKVNKPRGAPESPPIDYDDWYVPPTSNTSEGGEESTDSAVDDTLQRILQRLIEQEQGVDYITSAILSSNQESVVKIRDRAVIRIPAQPLKESVGLGIGGVRAPKKYVSGRLKVIGEIYEFKFDKPTKLEKPAELTVRYSLQELPDPSRAAIYWYNEQAQKWEYVGGRVDPAAGTITASLPHFSKYALLYNGDMPVFEDMPLNHWSNDMVYRLASIGAVNGVSSGAGLAFEPERSITRQEFAKMAVGALSTASASTPQEISAKFVDHELVATWAKPYITAAIEQGWLGGTARDEKLYLDPAVPISRVEAIAIIGRMMKVDTDAESADVSFTDAKAIPGWAKPYVSMLVKLGIISGYPDGSLHPDAQITREEAAAMISKMLDAKRNE